MDIMSMKRALTSGFTSCFRANVFRNNVPPGKSIQFLQLPTNRVLQRPLSSVSAAGKSALQDETGGNTQSLSLEQDLQRIFAALGMDGCSPGEHYNVSGKTTTWGIRSDWYMKWCLDGRFYEKFSNSEITQEWGHDGKTTWHADIAGRVLKLGMDEAEACLLTAWIRTGFWVTEDAQKFLEIKHKVDSSTKTELAFTVRLKKKEVVGLVLVNRNTWLPVRLSFGQCRQGRGWEFLNWQNLLPRHALRMPALSIRGSSTSRESFNIVKASLGVPEDENVYTFSDSLLLPRSNARYPKTTFDRSCSPTMQMMKSRTGHYVVRPLINGRDAGNFIVDTGTGTLAITQRMARQLGLSSFGEVNATSISGGHTLSTCFYRATKFELGPLKIVDPVFVQIGIDKLLKGAEGLLGYDIFDNSIVEMSHKDYSFSIYDPADYEASPRARQLKWQRMYLYDRVPHFLAKINGREVLLMLDTGAAGGLMFPSSAVQGFDDQEIPDAPATFGRGRNLYVSQVEYGNVGKFELAGCTFTDLTALVPNKSGQQLGLSGYCAGVVCIEMLKYFTVVFDYAHSRIAFVDRRLRSQNTRF